MVSRRAVPLLGLLLGAVGLLVQFCLSIPAYLAAGRDLPDALITFFSFYTILTNSVLVLIYLGALAPWPLLAWFRAPSTRAMMVGVMVLVMAFYHLVLSGLWAPEGLFKAADIVLHYATPLLYLLWWVVFAPHGDLGFSAVPIMLLPSLLYILYAMARGAIVSEYPYPILEADRLGYGPVLLNIAAVAVALALLLAIAVATDKLLARRTLA